MPVGKLKGPAHTAPKPVKPEVRSKQPEPAPKGWAPQSSKATLPSGDGFGGGRRNLPDPALMNADRSRLAYQEATGAIFQAGPAAADVLQGDLADCYLLAGLASLAHSEPSLLEGSIRDLNDGTYAVRVYDKPGGPEKWIEVDAELPVRLGLLKSYGRSADMDELWVSLVEKAFAKWRGGYEKIGNKGSAGEALTALTGRRWQFTRLKGGEAAVAARLKEDLSKGRVMVAATLSNPRKLEGTGLTDAHSYSLLGLKEEGGKVFVTLRDPRGWTQQGAGKEDEGRFELELSVFIRAFQGYHSV